MRSTLNIEEIIITIKEMCIQNIWNFNVFTIDDKPKLMFSWCIWNYNLQSIYLAIFFLFLILFAKNIPGLFQ